MATESNRPRVLVVDDSPTVRCLVDAARRLEGIETQRVGNGYDAIAAVATFQPHAIVLDVMMPGIDGFEVGAARLFGSRVMTRQGPGGSPPEPFCASDYLWAALLSTP